MASRPSRVLRCEWVFVRRHQTFSCHPRGVEQAKKCVLFVVTRAFKLRSSISHPVAWRLGAGYAFVAFFSNTLVLHSTRTHSRLLTTTKKWEAQKTKKRNGSSMQNKQSSFFLVVLLYHHIRALLKYLRILLPSVSRVYIVAELKTDCHNINKLYIKIINKYVEGSYLQNSENVIKKSV